MNTPNDGGPAFPRPASIDTRSGTLPDGDEVIPEQGGMSLRDWFAGQTIVGLLAATRTTANKSESQMAADFAGVAYIFADAMLAERAKKR